MGEHHIWHLGDGVIAEIKSNYPMGPRHVHMLRLYVSLLEEIVTSAHPPEQKTPSNESSEGRP